VDISDWLTACNWVVLDQNPRMATKFFTNKEGNTLLNKFQGVFAHTSVHYFDCLVGFFRASGHLKVRPLLESLCPIRNGIGIDVNLD